MGWNLYFVYEIEGLLQQSMSSSYTLEQRLCFNIYQCFFSDVQLEEPSVRICRERRHFEWRFCHCPIVTSGCQPKSHSRHKFYRKLHHQNSHRWEPTSLSRQRQWVVVTFIVKVLTFKVTNKLFQIAMEVLLRRGCCVWCNTEAATPPQPLHWRGKHGGGRPLRILLTLIYCTFIACLVLAHGLDNRPQLLTLAYSRVLTWVVEALLTTLVEGLEVCWLHLLLRVLGQLLLNNTSMHIASANNTLLVLIWSFVFPIVICCFCWKVTPATGGASFSMSMCWPLRVSASAFW